MALIIEANYSKKVGLPAYSSHQFSLTVKAEITDINQVAAESARLYRMLQDGVDTSLQEVGWLPESKSNGNGHNHPRNNNGNGNGNGHQRGNSEEPWQCSIRQKDLIIRIVEENHLDKNEIEKLAMERFGQSVKQLNKLEASGLIEELVEKYPRQQRNNRPPTTAR